MAPAREYENFEDLKKISKELFDINRTLLTQLEESSKREANKDSEAQTYVDEVSDRLEQQLCSERQTFEIYKRDAESTQRRQVTVETALRSKLSEAENISTQLREDVMRLTLRDSSLLSEIKGLEALLDRERGRTKLVLEEIGELRTNLSAEMERLKVRLAAEIKKLWEEFTAKTEKLQEELAAERQAMGRIKEMLNEAKRNEDALLKSVESLRSQVADERQNYYGLCAELKATRMQEVGFREQLLSENQDLDHLRMILDDAETLKTALSSEAKTLRSQLQSEQQRSGQLSDAFQRETRDLSCQVATQRANIDQLDRELSTLKTKNSALGGQLSSERQTLLRLQESLDQANTVENVLMDETKSSQAKLEAECQESARLTHELAATQTREAALAQYLERQVATTAAQEADFWAEIVMMQEQIEKLESRAVYRRLSALGERFKSLMKSSVSCLTGGGLRRRMAHGDESE